MVSEIKNSWNEMHSEPRQEVMFDAGGGTIRSNFTKGGVNYFTKFDDANVGEDHFYSNHSGFYGWMGYGGSVLQWNPDKKIGFAFSVPDPYIGRIWIRTDPGVFVRSGSGSVF